MTKSQRTYFLISTFTIAFAIAFGAFGAHGLKKIVTPDLLATFETGVRYQAYTGLGLLALTIFRMVYDEVKICYGFWMIFIGMLIFSGLLYLYVLTGIKIFAMIVPIGGLSMILGWLIVGFRVYFRLK